MNKRKQVKEAYPAVLKAVGGKKHTALEIIAEEFGISYETASRYLRKDSRGGKQNKRIGERWFILPDTQCKPKGSIEHIKAAARYCVKKRPDGIVCMGDWWDMESLSVYNSRRQSEGKRIIDDITAGEEAMDAFMEILKEGIPKSKMPKLVFLHGNHSMAVRLPRFIEDNPHLEGLVEDTTTNFLESHGWEVHPFLDVVNINGIRFSHYIQNPHSLKGSPLSGQIDTMLKNAGFSFVMGHQQTFKMGKHFLSDGTQRLGIVAGAFYVHDEDYMSVQGNQHWRGCIMLNEMKDGSANICEVSLEYLMNNYGD